MSKAHTGTIVIGDDIYLAENVDIQDGRRPAAKLARTVSVERDTDCVVVPLGTDTFGVFALLKQVDAAKAEPQLVGEPIRMASGGRYIYFVDEAEA